MNIVEVFAEPNKIRHLLTFPCLRWSEDTLSLTKVNFEDGKYKNDVEAEADFRQLVDRDEGCK